MSILATFITLPSLGKFKDVSLSKVMTLVSYRNLLALSQDNEFAAVDELLSNYGLSGTFSSTECALLGKFWKQDWKLVESLVQSLNLSNVSAIDAVEYVRKCVEICVTLGVNGSSLQQLASDGDFTKISSPEISL